MGELIAVVVGVVLGWLLGLVSEPIIAAINRPRERRELAGAIREELADVRDRAVVTAFHLRRKHGTFRRPQMEWTAQQLEHSANDDARQIAETLTNELGLTDEQLERLNHVFRANTAQAAAATVSTLVPLLETPFFDAQIHRLGVFSQAAQQALLRARVEVRIFNEVAQDARRFTALTFDSALTPENHTRVIGNLRSTEEKIALRAEQIARTVARANLLTEKKPLRHRVRESADRIRRKLAVGPSRVYNLIADRRDASR
jgi:hypothetical protein